MPKSKMMRKKKVNGETYLEGSDNVFRDLGFPEEEAVNMLARSEMIIQIKEILDERELTQNEAAKLLGVRQPRVSALYTGKLNDFTIDMLMKWLTILGKKVTIQIEDQVVA